MSDLMFCPCCGTNLRADEEVSLGEFHYDPRGIITWRGDKVAFTTNETIIFGALLRAKGRFVTASALAEMVGHDGLGNVVQVTICRIRRKLHALTGDAVVQNTRMFGYRAVGATVAQEPIAA